MPTALVRHDFSVLCEVIVCSCFGPTEHAIVQEKMLLSVPRQTRWQIDAHPYDSTCAWGVCTRRQPDFHTVELGVAPTIPSTRGISSRLSTNQASSRTKAAMNSPRASRIVAYLSVNRALSIAREHRVVAYRLVIPFTVLIVQKSYCGNKALKF